MTGVLYTQEEIANEVKKYFGKSLKEVSVEPSVADYHVWITYQDFKSEANVRRELSNKMPFVDFYVEREISDRCWMKAIDDLSINDTEIFVKDVSGNLKSFTFAGFLIDYMRATDFLN
ncbi:MAG: hypothetical protein ACI36Z_10125 [Alloprevotella sp.]